MPNKPTDDARVPSADALAEIMQLRLSKNPELAAKQARLLEQLRADAEANRPETEADGYRAGELRLLKAQRYADSLRKKSDK